MLTFTNQKSLTIKRQVYTGDKSTYTAVSGNFSGYLRPMTEEQSAVNGVQFGLGFMLITEIDVDIRQGDRVTIDSVGYTIRGVVNHDRGGVTKYKRAVMTKPENQ